MHSPLLAPLVALVVWSMIMLGWLYVTRIPAIMKAKIKLDPRAPRGEQMSTLPAPVRWKADNYNHLMEQPTIFYAVVFALILLEQATPMNLGLAWGYVGLRVVHSLVQALVNKIEVRFAIFFTSSLVLAGLVFNAAVAVF